MRAFTITLIALTVAIFLSTTAANAAPVQDESHLIIVTDCSDYPKLCSKVTDISKRNSMGHGFSKRGWVDFKLFNRFKRDDVNDNDNDDDKEEQDSMVDKVDEKIQENGLEKRRWELRKFWVV